MSDDPKLGAGDVKIELAGKPYTLKASYEAALRISRYPGSIQAVSYGILGQNLEAISITIAAGLDMELDENLMKQVYETGVMHLVGPVGTYISNLSNGGRPLFPETKAAPKKGTKGPQLNA